MMDSIAQKVTPLDVQDNDSAGSLQGLFSGDSGHQLHFVFYSILPFFFCLFCFVFYTASAHADITVLNESFSDCSIPANWLVVPDSNDCQWFFDGYILFNNTGGEGCYAMADSDACEDAMDTALITPILDCSKLARAFLTFKYDMTEDSSSTFTVAVSSDGGINWTVILEYTATASGEIRVDVSSLVAGKSQVRIRFQYITTDWEDAWQIDDVTLIGQPFPWAIFLPAILAR